MIKKIILIIIIGIIGYFYFLSQIEHLNSIKQEVINKAMLEKKKITK